MFRMVKLALVSAALAAALVAALEGGSEQSSAGKFLTDRVEHRAVPVVPANKLRDVRPRIGNEACRLAWPYAADCIDAGGAPRREVRLVSADRTRIAER